MTVARALLVLLMFVTVAVTIVLVRAESAKASNRIQKLHHREVYLKQQRCKKEMELARLRGPEEIRKRTNTLGLEVVPPARDRLPKKGGRVTD